MTGLLHILRVRLFSIRARHIYIHIQDLGYIYICMYMKSLERVPGSPVFTVSPISHSRRAFIHKSSTTSATYTAFSLSSFYYQSSHDGYRYNYMFIGNINMDIKFYMNRRRLFARILQHRYNLQVTKNIPQLFITAINIYLQFAARFFFFFSFLRVHFLMLFL